jgi:hypothetical protein
MPAVHTLLYVGHSECWTVNSESVYQLAYTNDNSLVIKCVTCGQGKSDFYVHGMSADVTIDPQRVPQWWSNHLKVAAWPCDFTASPLLFHSA